MKKILIVTALVAVAACSSDPDYRPVVDLKASENPGEMQADWMACEWLSKKHSDTWFDDYDAEMVRRCLQGRGHSVLK